MDLGVGVELSGHTSHLTCLGGGAGGGDVVTILNPTYHHYYGLHY